MSAIVIYGIAKSQNLPTLKVCFIKGCLPLKVFFVEGHPRSKMCFVESWFAFKAGFHQRVHFNDPGGAGG